MLLTLRETRELDFYDLQAECWGNALFVLNDIEKAEVENELIALLNEIFAYDDIVDITKVNDFLSYEDKFIYDTLDITKTEDEED